MNIKRNICIATVTAVAAAGLGTGMSAPAMAYTPATGSAITLTSGPIKPVVKKKMTWRECWRGMYFGARDSGSSVSGAEAEADLACGRSPDEF
jgi:hypothetical protein